MKNLVTLLALVLGTAPAWAQAPVRVLVNGEPINFASTTSPENRLGSVMVPANQVFSRLGFAVSYNATTRLVTASKPKPGGVGTYSLSFTAGSAQVVVNGVALTLTAAQTPYVKNDYSMIWARLVGEAANCKVDFDQETQSVQVYYYDEMEAGLYFVGKQDDARGDQTGGQKYTPGVANPFFNPSRPTIIYVHGNQPGAIAAKTRESLYFEATGAHTQNGWIDRGWNVAIFNWSQLADDASGFRPYNAEYKMYGTAVGNGRPGTRWRRSDNSFAPTNWPQTVTDIFLDEYAELLPAVGTILPEIELVGNSLGGQLVMTAVAKMKYVKGYQSSSGSTLLDRMPKRITLMDPYWTDVTASGLTGTTFNPAQPGVSFPQTFGRPDLKQAVGAMVGASSAPNVRSLPISYYRTSLLGWEGTSTDLAEQVAFIELKPDYVGATGGLIDVPNAVKRHTWPVRGYFASIACNGGGRQGGLEVTSGGSATANEADRTGAYRASTSVCSAAPGTGNQVGGALLSPAAIRAMMTLYAASSPNGPYQRTRGWAQLGSTSPDMNTLRYTVALPNAGAPYVEQAAAAAAATAAPLGTEASPLAVAVAPNPSTGPLLLDYTLPTAGSIRLQVSDLLGRVRQTLHPEAAETAGSHTLRADLSELPAGPYLLTCYLNGAKVQTIKIMKGE